jgi:hypothetical protein
MKNENSEVNRYAQMGMAALLPGMQHMVDLMQRQLDEMRQQLAVLQEEPLPKARGKRISAGKSGWGGMSAAERSAEMQRRIVVRKRNQAAKLNPRHKDHPDHAQWVANLAKAGRARWAKKTKAEKEAWKAAMAAGKVKARKAKVKNDKSPVDLAIAS